MATMNYMYMGLAPSYQQKTTTGSQYGVVKSIAGWKIYRVSISGKTVTAQSKVGSIPVGDAVIIQQTGAGFFITSKIGMAEKIPEVVVI